MALPVNPTNLNFQLPTTYADGTQLNTADIQDIAILVGNTQGGPYPKTVQDTDLTPDANGFCHYPIAKLGLSAGTWFAVTETEMKSGVDSAVSSEVGFVVAPIPNPPQAVSVS